MVGSLASFKIEHLRSFNFNVPQSNIGCFELTAQHLFLPVALPFPSCSFARMMRTALLQPMRCASRVTPRIQPQISRSTVPCSYAVVTRPVSSVHPQGIRFYSAPSGLSKDEVQGRIMDILKNFDKVWYPFGYPRCFQNSATDSYRCKMLPKYSTICHSYVLNTKSASSRTHRTSPTTWV